MKRESPHSALVASLDAEGLALLSAALDERACREEPGFGTFAEAAELFRCVLSSQTEQKGHWELSRVRT